VTVEATTAVRYFVPSQLQDFASSLFQRASLPSSDAAIVADGLVAANLRGIDSHGVSRIPMYLERLRRGVVNPRPDVQVERVASAVSLVDGDNGMGFIPAHRAMDEAMLLAKDAGIGFVGVRRSTHFGMAAIYVQKAISAGYIGFSWTNSSPAIPVWGGRTAFLGAAPFAAAIPGGHTPYLLDMAMTVIARGKIRLAAMHGEKIAEGLALDADGQPTRDAKKAFEGVCLPFGGVKGSALSMLMDLMCGVLTGAGFAGSVKSLYFDHSEPQNVGHVCIALRPDLFMSRQQFETRMDHFVDTVKGLPRAPDVEEILIPGQPEERTEFERRRTGIPITPDIIALLSAEAKTAGLILPNSSSEPQNLAPSRPQSI
jgi:LDH2 family malate/lactate/ureidoglycolate dehydrogenase